MRIRRLAACALATTVGLTGATSTAQGAAKPKPKPKGPPPLCHLIVSPEGDTPTVLTSRNGAVKLALDTTGQKLPYQKAPGYDPALDLLSADIASNATTVTVVFRLVKLGGPDTTAPTGRFYSFEWAWGSSGVAASLSVDITPQGNSFAGGTNAKVVVDLAHNEIRINQPLDSLQGHPLFPPGERMVSLRATTDLANPAIPGLHTTSYLMGESATTNKSYPHRAPSCVKVGA